MLLACFVGLRRRDKHIAEVFVANLCGVAVPFWCHNGVFLLLLKDFTLMLAELGKAEEADDGFSGVIFRIEAQFAVRKH